ncbi:hypothetical protein ACN28E_54470 [Archangium lansingense]|uniref:hypothetical protein n=1 Tax=Archangium lansingense TaxID=2995310 RepID=UPI003B7A2364
MKPTPFIAMLASLLVAEPTAAYTVATGFSEACHERLTLAAWSRALAERPSGFIPPPRGNAAELLSAHVLREHQVSAYDERQRNLVLNLVLGVQAPDTHGHSVLELENTRAIHADPGDQYAHALRAPEDDGPEGDRAAIAGTRAHIKGLLERFRAELEKPRDEQFIQTRHYLDYYGMIELEAWTPAFYLGEALHALQDSFSHSIRSDDFRRIRHVLNYGDAISHHFDEHRDGLRHSSSLDTCGDDTVPVVHAATEASADLLLAAMAGGGQVDAMLDRWMGYEEGCTLANDYCQSPWTAVARKEPTKPYLGCTAAPDAVPQSLPWLLTLLCLGWRRRARRWSR